jgi:hypothetical protein
MRERARQMRRIAGMAHDPTMIKMLLSLADEAEADAAQLEAQDHIQVPPPRQH